MRERVLAWMLVGVFGGMIFGEGVLGLGYGGDFLEGPGVVSEGDACGLDGCGCEKDRCGCDHALPNVDMRRCVIRSVPCQETDVLGLRISLDYLAGIWAVFDLGHLDFWEDDVEKRGKFLGVFDVLDRPPWPA